MVKNQPQPSLEELAVKAKTAALKAKDNSLNSTQRQQALLEKQIALTKLMTELMAQIQIKLPKPSHINSQAYIYEEALQDVLLHVCKNIDKYDPAKGFIISWVVFLLKKKKIDYFSWLTWQGKVISIYKEGDAEIDILDIYCPPDVSNPFSAEELIAFIKKDPERLLANKLFKKNQKASFQAILLKRGEEGKSWKEIVQELELGATHGPVSIFYRRCCEEFAPYFKKYLGE